MEIYQCLQKGGKPTGCVYESQDAMIASFLGQGLSESQVCSFLPVDGRKVQRIRNELKDPSLREKRNEPKMRSHAVFNEDIARLVEQAKEWDLEDGLRSALFSSSIYNPNSDLKALFNYAIIFHKQTSTPPPFPQNDFFCSKNGEKTAYPGVPRCFR